MGGDGIEGYKMSEETKNNRLIKMQQNKILKELEFEYWLDHMDEPNCPYECITLTSEQFKKYMITGEI